MDTDSAKVPDAAAVVRVAPYGSEPFDLDPADLLSRSALLVGGDGEHAGPPLVAVAAPLQDQTLHRRSAWSYWCNDLFERRE